MSLEKSALDEGAAAFAFAYGRPSLHHCRFDLIADLNERNELEDGRDLIDRSGKAGLELAFS